MRVKIRKGDTVEIISGKIEDTGQARRSDQGSAGRAPGGGAGREYPYQTPAPGPDAGTHDQPRPHQVRSPARYLERYAGLPEVQRTDPCQCPARR